MPNLSTSAARGFTLIHNVAPGMPPNRLQQYKLDRLLELRAVIDSLRSQESDQASEAVFEEHCLET